MTKAEVILNAINSGATDEELVVLENTPEEQFTVEVKEEEEVEEVEEETTATEVKEDPTPEGTTVKEESTVSTGEESSTESQKFSELDKENDRALRPDRYDVNGDLKPEFEVYTDSKGITHSRKVREKTDTSVGENDYVFRIDKTKDKVGQVVDMYNTVNENDEEVKGLLKSRPDPNIQDVIEEVQKSRYKAITDGMSQEELDDMHLMLKTKKGLNVTTTGIFALPEVVVEEDFITTEVTKIDIKRGKQVRALLADIDFNNKEVKEIIAEEYFDFSGIPLRNTGKPEDIIHDNRLLAKTIPLEKQQQFRRWKETGELPMYSSVDGFGISMDMINNAVASVKDKTVQTYFEGLSIKERFDVMKHMPSATPGTTSFVDYYKQRRKDEIDFKKKYGYTLSHKQKGPSNMDDRIYTPVNDYGADWAKHFSKAVNESSNDYIKKTSDRVIKDNKDLELEKEKFNALNGDFMARANKLNRELEGLGRVTSDSPPDVIDNYNAIIGELRVLKQNIADRGLGDIYADISRRSEKLKADIDGLTDVAEVNEDLSIIAYASGLNYSNIDRTVASIEKGLVNPVSVAGSDLIDFVSADTWDLGGKARQHSIKTDEDFEETFSRNLSFSWQNLDIWLPQALANNSASIAAVGGFFVNPALGYSLFFGMGYGHKVTDITRSRQAADKQIEGVNLKLSKVTTEDERLSLLKQKDDWQRKKDISYWQERTSGILAGTSELVWERLGSVNAIKNFSKWSRVVGKSGFKRAMGVGYGIGLTQVIELGEETGTEITNNISDIVNLKEDKTIIDGMNKDFFANVIVTGLALQGKNIGQTTWNLFSEQVRTRDQKKINGDRLQRIHEIDEQLQNPLTLNSIEVEKLENEKMDLIEQAGIETVMNIDNLNNLTFEEKQVVFEKARQAQETLRELEALGATGDLTSNYAKKNKKFLMDKYNELVGEKDQLLDKNGKEIRERAKNSNNPAAAAYNAGFNNFANNLARYNANKNGKQFTQINDISNLKQNEELFDDYQEILEAYEAGDYAFHSENGDVYVFQENVDNQIYGTVATNTITGEKVYSDNNTLEAMIAAVSPLHENLHDRNRTVGIIKDGKVVESAVEAIEGIEAEMQSLLAANRITQEVFDLFKARKDLYTDENSGQVNMEELINLVGDLHFIGALPISSFNNLFGLKSLLNNAASYFFEESAPMFKFKTKDIFGYVQSFYKQSKSRKLKLSTRVTDDKKAISLSKSTYDQFSPEELVEIIKDPLYDDTQTIAAENSLTKQFDLLALDALKYDTRKGDIAREEVIAAAREYLPGIINRFNPESAKFSTFVNGNIAPKQAVIYEEAKSLSFETVSLDAPQAQQLADETTEVESNLTEDKITKVNVLQVGKIASKQNEIRKATKVKKGDTHKQITDNNKGNIGSVIFNIPANKIANPKDNITTSSKIVNPQTGKPVKKGETGIPERSEATNIQDHFADINTAKSFIKILNPTNVSEKDADINKIGENIRVSRNVYGRAIGLPNRILEYFYDQAFKPDGKRLRSQGLTSQVGMWKLKPKFKNLNDTELTKVAEQFQRDLGITEQQEVNKLPTKENRSVIGQLLKGAAVVASMQVSLSSAQRRLAAFPTLARRGAKKAKAQEIADVTAGQSKLAFSKTGKTSLDNGTKRLNKTLNNSDNIIEAREEAGNIDPEFIDKENRDTLNKNLAFHKLKPMHAYDSATDIDFIIKGFKRISTVLNQETANYTIFFKSDRHIPANVRNNLIVDPKTGEQIKVRDYYKREIRIAFPPKTTYGKKFTGPASKYRKGKKFGKLYGQTAADFRAAMKTGRNYEGSGENTVKLTIPEINEMHESMGTQLWQRINDDINGPNGNRENARIWANYLDLATNNTEHPHRQWAEFIGWTKKPLGSNPKGNIDPNSEGYKVYEWEHAMQSAKSINYLMHSILGDYNFDAAFELIRRNYKLIALDNYDDKVKLKGAKRTHSMGDGWTVLDAFHKRYQDEVVAAVKGKNGNGINPEGIETIFDGKTMGEHYNINTEGQPRGVKPNIVKNKKLDKVIVFSRTVNPAKGITVLDFDDTLATTKSGVRAKVPNPDGTPKPGRKVIFLAGGAGSGKSNVISKLGLKDQGFKIVNSDISLEWLKENSGLPANMNDFTKEQRSKLGSLQHQARGIARRKQMKYQGEGNGVVVDGTGGSIKSMEKLVNEFKEKGYDVSMMFVETSLPVALERNAARKERSLLDKIVTKNHEAVQGNKDGFKTMFGDRFMEVNTDNLSQQDAMPTKLTEQMNDFVSGYENRRLDAEEFANEGADILDQGGTFDFSEFNKVVEGQTAPLFNKAMKLQGKFGNKDMFVLTARPAESAPAIFEFLQANGLNIPLENITGLANSTSEAKALWMAEKVGDGYNDFYFADDALQNVQAVQNMLDQFDVKSKVQQAKIQFSKNISPTFNDILESTTGVESQKEFSDAQARLRGRNTKYKGIIPASAQDFQGLLYNFLGKGKKGEADMAFFKEALIDPFARGIKELNTSRQSAANDFENLNKNFPDVKRKLNKNIEGLDYTNDQAIRVYLWNKAGFEVPGLSKRDLAALTSVVQNNPEIQAYADAIGLISKKDDGYSQPKDYWLAESIASDLLSDGAIGDVRAKFLGEWQQNVDQMFSKENLNKIESIYGSKFREALEDSLYRMRTGKNRPMGGGRLMNGYMNWVNNSVGAIMFFNMRSAILQTISATNYMNWSFNNPAKAAAAFANQPQYWKDFSMIFNSPYLKQRRSGNQRGINEAELSEAVAGSENKAKTAIAWLLKKGFLPTQLADSFAIASGGASFYRNKVKALIKEGMTQEQAEAQAFIDFQEVTEVSQQSARPDMISQQQASPLGRLILSFQNTPMQYARIINKAARDLANGRGDYKTHMSKIAYYGVAQGILFGSLQSALFAALGEDEEEEYDKKKERIINGMIDSLLSGIGYGGKAISTAKNTIREYAKQKDKGWNADHTYTILQLLGFSPPIGSKLRKIYGSIQTEQFNQGVFEKRGLTLDNPIWSAVGNVVEGVTNVPLGRLAQKMLNIDNALDDNNKWWERAALLLGWNTWDLGIRDKDIEAVKDEVKEEKKIESKKRAKIKKEKKKKEKEEENKAVIEDNKKKSKKDGVCSAVSKSGKRCKTKVVEGKLFCTVHEKAEQNQTGEKSQCKKVKKGNKRCKMQTSSKSGYCYYHD